MSDSVYHLRKKETKNPQTPDFCKSRLVSMLVFGESEALELTVGLPKLLHRQWEACCCVFMVRSTEKHSAFLPLVLLPLSVCLLKAGVEAGRAQREEVPSGQRESLI